MFLGGLSDAPIVPDQALYLMFVGLSFGAFVLRFQDRRLIVLPLYFFLEYGARLVLACARQIPRSLSDAPTLSV
jgi:hypothetical protein